MQKLRKDDKGGFTLIELVVVMAIMALLALLIIGAVIIARQMVNETKHRNNGRAIQVALEKEFAAKKAYNTSNVTAGETFASAASDLGITLDTTTECAAGSAGYGGGVVSAIGADTFTLTVYKHDCTTSNIGEIKAPN